MTTIRRIVTSKIDGNGANENDVNEIRPFGETAFYLDTSGNTNKLALMMFDGIRTHQKSKVLSPGVLYGSNADSGDGAGLDTIKLIPDTILHYDDGNYNNHQHLVIDPTAPDHIHIRAGGPIDNSNAELFLGGELTHVRVSDNQDNVVIRTSTLGEGVTPHSWTFGANGLLSFPDGTESSGNGIWPPVNVGLGITLTRNPQLSAVAGANSGEGALYIDISENDDISEVNIFWQLNTGTSTAPILTPVTSSITPETGIYAIFVSGFTFVPGETYTFRRDSIDAVDWVFLPTGELRTSGLGTISHYPGPTSSLKFEVPSSNDIVLRTAGGDLTLGTDGSLTLPNGSPILFGNGNSRIQAGMGFHINSEEGISLEAVNITDPLNPVSYGWYFDTNGNLTLPAAGDILDSTGASVLGGGGGTATGVSRSDDNLIIQLTDTNTEGLELRSIVVDGNDLNISSTVLGANGFVISTNSNVSQKQWQFGNDGGLTFPDATVQTTSYTGTGAITFTGNEIQGNTFGGTGTIITKTVDSNGNDYSTGSGSLGFLNFGTDGTIQNVKAGWIVTFANGATRTVSQDAYQPLGTYWNIGFDSGYVWSAGNVMPVTFSSPDYAAGTAPQVTLTAGTESWTFSENGTITLPDGMTIETAYGGGPTLVVDGKTHTVELRSDNTILIGYNDSSGNVYIGNPEGVGQVDIVGPKFRVFANAPTASTGAAGDQAGQIAFNGSYIYYCTADYSDGLSNIWKRLAWSGDTW